ncbi:MAG: hypothetical protein IPH62_06785 [Ignavibacteriae bacterium]|nr:hypothetical protein [Ignavibacteriota bacterium]
MNKLLNLLKIQHIAVYLMLIVLSSAQTTKAQNHTQLDLLNKLLLDGNKNDFCLSIIDINNDKFNDLSVVSGDSLRVYVWLNNNYKLILNGIYCHGNHPKILPVKTNGYHDLEVNWVFRGAETKVYYKFNGKNYYEYSWKDEPF